MSHPRAQYSNFQVKNTKTILYASSIPKPNLILHPQENGCHIHNIEAILKVDIHSESLVNNLQLCCNAIIDQAHSIFSNQLGASTSFWEQNLCSQEHSF